MKKAYLIFFLLVQKLSFAQLAFNNSPEIICLADTTSTNPISSIASPKFNKVTSNITVTYSGFTEAQKTAFQAAVDIWSKIIVSQVPIKISANYQSLGTNVLASTNATKVFRNFSSSALTDVWYPVALAEAVAGSNLNDNESEIYIRVNTDINWSLNTDGTAVYGKFDLMTVVLHEIAHGLGFASTFNLATNNSQVYWGQSNFPYIYDVFLQNQTSQKLTNTANFANPSALLFQEATSNQIFFYINDLNIIGVNPQIYAPSTFSLGESLTHLDETKYPNGTENALMTPKISSGEINHFPGLNTLAILNQIGWGVNQYFGDTVLELEKNQKMFVVFPNPCKDNFQIIVSPEIKNYTVEIMEPSGKIIQTNANSKSIDCSKLNAGNYLVKLKTDDYQFIKKLIKL